MSSEDRGTQESTGVKPPNLLESVFASLNVPIAERFDQATAGTLRSAVGKLIMAQPCYICGKGPLSLSEHTIGTAFVHDEKTLAEFCQRHMFVRCDHCGSPLPVQNCLYGAPYTPPHVPRTEEDNMLPITAGKAPESEPLHKAEGNEHLRVVVIQGHTLCSGSPGWQFRLVDNAQATVSLIGIPPENENENRRRPDALSRPINFDVQMRLGTVDELVELYRQSLLQGLAQAMQTDEHAEALDATAAAFADIPSGIVRPMFAPSV